MRRGLLVIIDSVIWHRDYVSKIARSRGFQTMSFENIQEAALIAREPDILFLSGDTHVHYKTRNGRTAFIARPVTAIDLDHICLELNL